MKRIIIILLIALLTLTACSTLEENIAQVVVDNTSSNSVEVVPEKSNVPQARPEGNEQDSKEAPIDKDLPTDMLEDLIIPEALSDHLKEQIEALPLQAQNMILSELPDEITDEVIAEIEENLVMIQEKFNSEDFKNRDEGDRPNNKEGHHGSSSVEAYTSTERIDLTDGDYKDGTYTGVADAYAPDLTVSITIEDNAITEITITDHNETPGFYEDAFERVPELIISSQNTDVDTVSGATMSSQGIIVAVENALAKAK